MRQDLGEPQFCVSTIPFPSMSPERWPARIWEPKWEEIMNLGVRLGKVNKPYMSSFLKEQLRTSLVVQWLRIWLPKQEATRVQPLVQEDPSGQPSPSSHSYEAGALEKPLQWEARVPHLESSPRSLQREETQAQQQDTEQPGEKKSVAKRQLLACFRSSDQNSLIRWREIE